MPIGCLAPMGQCLVTAHGVIACKSLQGLYLPLDLFHHGGIVHPVLFGVFGIMLGVEIASQQALIKS